MTIASVPVALRHLDVAVAQSGSTSERVMVALSQILGLSLVAAGVAAVVALGYRWYVRERVPGGLPALIGLSAIVPFLGVNQLLRTLIEPVVGQSVVDEATAVFNIAAFLVALGATRLGTDAGDRLGQDFFASTGERAIESEVGRVVQAVGRVITVELPDEIEDIVGYDPVPDATRETLAGTTFVFPRRLTVEQLHDRLVTRLKADYAVGHVDLELAADGAVEYLAVGSRAAGIGPTLPPETSAVAVRADPAFAASAGDLVQVWRTDPFQRVLTAEVRGTVDDVVTLAIDAADTRKLDAETRYKLVTLPVEARPDREFASVLRAADETMAAITVGDWSPLAGHPVGALDVSIVAVRPTEGAVEPLPARDRLLGPGDALYLVATPEAIRKVEAWASPVDGHAGPAVDGPSAGTGAHLGPDEQVDATTPVSGTAAEKPEPEPPSAGADQPEPRSSGTVTAESAETSESSAAESPQSPESTGAESSASSESSEPANSTEVSESAKSADTSEPAESAEASESAKSADTSDASESTASSEPAESAETEDQSDSSEASESSESSVLPIDEFADTPGIEALEPDESDAADDTTQAELSTEDTPGIETLESDDTDEESPDPTRADLESLPGTDVNDLSGIRDVSGDEATADEDTAQAETKDERPGETQPDDAGDDDADKDTADADDDSWVNAAETGDDPLEPSTDDTAEDEESTGNTTTSADESDDDAGTSSDESGWSVAVDERRDSEEDE